ncbi:MAG TPA: polysaccharide deacetylase family protein [Bacillota bacterium]
MAMDRRRRYNLLLIAALVPILLATVWWQAPTAEDGPVLPAAAASGRRLPIYSVETPGKTVAISFDAAWGADKTPVLLDILDQFGVKTTFFLVSFWVEDYPDMAREIVRRGHELGLHSATHPDFTTLSKEQIQQELRHNYETIVRVTGFRPKLFRPPFGAYNNRVIETVEDEEGFITIQWSVDSLDWKNVSADFIVQRVLGAIRPGDIVLFHNNAEATPAALPRILERLQADGYAVVPISQLIYKENYRIDHTGRQIPLR